MLADGIRKRTVVSMTKALTKMLVITAALALAVSAGAQYVGETCGFNYVHDLGGPVGPAMNWPF
jgi:hypothetical protein